MSQKLNTPKGTRDFSSLELKKREYLLNVLKNCFKSFNFQEIQTPSFENLTTLIGKYGDEEDNLMFKILASGDKIKKADIDAFKDNKLSKFSNSLLHTNPDRQFLIIFLFIENACFTTLKKVGSSNKFFTYKSFGLILKNTD